MGIEDSRRGFEWIYADFPWQSEEFRDNFWKQRRVLLEHAGNTACKSISFDELVEGETPIRLAASYTLVQEGLMAPDMIDGLKLTKDGERQITGMQALDVG